MTGMTPAETKNKQEEGQTPASAPLHKALIWGRENLLAHSVELFLDASRKWQVIRVSPEDGDFDLVEAAARISPEVVILCADGQGGDSVLPLRLIEVFPCLKVVVIGLESNLLQVYSRQHVMIEGVSDLLSILETGNFSDCALEKEAGLAKQTP